MQIGDYTAHILVDDQELEEHGIKFDPGPPRKEITCWIASEAGKTFTIKWCCLSETRTDGNAGWVTLDGIFCGGSPMYPGRSGDGDTGEMCTIDTDTKTRDFMFSRIQLSDDDRLLNKELPKGFGEISLEIEYGKLVRDRRVRHREMGVPDDNDKVHETSNKAAHHRIGFGPERARKDQPSTYISRLRVDKKKPSLWFVFKYRPLNLLQAHGIVPAPAPDARPSPKPNRSQSNDLRRVELEREKQDMENKLKRLNQELKALSEEPMSKRIKHENSPLRSCSVCVIDLTQD